MPGGRPTSDPKGTLIAVRLADRHVQWLRHRAATEGVSLSEALRRLLDQQPPPKSLRGRPPTAKEQQMFDQVLAAFGLVPTRRRRQRKR
jgi:hypothetical protein